MTEYIHVYPLFDIKQHITAKQLECWCRPTLSANLIIHNAFDGREPIKLDDVVVH